MWKENLEKDPECKFGVNRDDYKKPEYGLNISDKYLPLLSSFSIGKMINKIVAKQNV